MQAAIYWPCVGINQKHQDDVTEKLEKRRTELKSLGTTSCYCCAPRGVSLPAHQKRI